MLQDFYEKTTSFTLENVELEKHVLRARVSSAITVLRDRRTKDRWTLMNLPPELRSNLQSINLLGAIEANLIRKYGHTKFLLETMKEFEGGVCLKLKGKDIKITCILLGCAGDMPAMNSLADFKESSSKAFRPFRVYLIPRREVNFIHSHEECILHNKLSHTQQLEDMPR